MADIMFNLVIVVLYDANATLLGCDEGSEFLYHGF